MRKYIILILIIKLCPQSLISQGITESEAYLIANKVYQIQKFDVTENLPKTTKKSLKQANLAKIEFDNLKNFYAFNYPDSGFVIISKFNQQKPVLAYSSNGKLNNKGIPPALHFWLSLVEKSTSNITSGNIQKEYLGLELKTEENTNIIGEKKPLLKTHWGQGLYYNDFCPRDVNSIYPNNHVPVGCVATAIGQIMRYWEYPEKGIGANSYYHNTYGNLETDFTESKYQWDLMTEKALYRSNPIAKLLSDCGISINTNYTATQSYAGTADATLALKNNFGYKNTTRCISKQNYSIDAWNCKIRYELDNDRPVLMQGSTYNELYSHAFVCDGYQGDYFHFNWGWEGAFDGYFLFDANLIESINFSFNLYATIGIEPADNFCTLSKHTIIINDQSTHCSTFKILTNTNWEICVDKPWVKVSSKSGKGNTEIKLWVDSLITKDTTCKANITIQAENNILCKLEVLKTSMPIYAPIIYSQIDSIHDTFQIITDKGNYSKIYEGDSVFINFTLKKLPWMSFSYWVLVNDSLVNNTFISENADSIVHVNKLYVGSFLKGENKVALYLDPYNIDSMKIIAQNIIIENKIPTIDVNHNLFVISGESGNINLDIFTTGEWKINSNENWIHPDYNCGFNDDCLNISIDANYSGLYREGLLILNNDEYQLEIKIKQEASITTNSDLLEKYVKIFPNPSSDFINIESKVKINYVCITDINGRIVYKTDNYNGAIDIQTIPTGKYILIINEGGKTLKRKFIKY